MHALVFPIALAAACLSGLAAAAGSLPRQMTWTSPVTNSTAFAQAEVIAKMLKNAFGTEIEVLRHATAAGRLAPLRDGKAQFCVCGTGAYFAQEGVLQFAAKPWGPQALLIVAAAKTRYNLALATAGDANIRRAADLKGKRISWLRGRNGVNWGTGAHLAFAGLTWGDVKIVDTADFKASIDAVIAGRSDAVLLSTAHPYARRLQDSKRGLAWLALPHDDDAGWRRLRSVHPIARANIARRGVAIDPKSGQQGFAQAYPVLIATKAAPADLVYTVLKAMMERHGDYRAEAPGAEGWALEKQSLFQAWPQHPGAIRYWRESGLWNPKAQAHQQELEKRQRVLAAAWREFLNLDAGDGAAWAQIRARALTAAGAEAVFLGPGLR